MAKLRLLKTGHGDLTLAEWDKDRPETMATAPVRFHRELHGRAAGVPARRSWPDDRRSASSTPPRRRS